MKKVGRKKRFSEILLILLSGMWVIYPSAIHAEEVKRSFILEPIIVSEELGIMPSYPGGQVATGSRVGILGNRSFMDTPFTITSYTSQTIENQMAGSVAEVAKNDPAVRYQYPSGAFMDNYRIRNFTFNGGNMTLNGVMGMAPYGIAGTEFLERVEIQRGPNTFANGINPGGEIAGGINLVTKKATDEPVRHFTLGHMNNSSIGGHLDIGERFGKKKEVGVRFNGVYRDGRRGVENQSQKRQMAVLGLDYTTKKLRATLDTYYIKDEFEEAVPFLVQYRNPALMDSGKLLSPPDPGRGIKGVSGEIENKGILFHTDYNFNEHISAYGSLGKSLGHYKGSVGGGIFVNPDVAGNGKIMVSDDDVWIDKIAYEGGIRTNFRTGDIKHEMVLGGSVLKLDNGNGSNSAMFMGNLYSGELNAAGLLTSPDKTIKIQEYRMSSFALADTLKLDNDKLQVTVGIRRQKVDQTRYNPNTGVLMQEYDESKTTPVFGLVAKPWGDKLSLYASYVEGLRPGSVVPNSPMYANAGEVFAPYSSKQMEFGVKVNSGRFANTLSYYQIKQPSQFLTPYSAGKYLFSMDGLQKNSGVEWMSFGKLTDNLKILGGVSYGKAKVVRSQSGNAGKEAFGSPRVQANIGFEWEAPWDRNLTLTTRATYTGKQYANSASIIELPSSIVFDLGARYKTKIGGNPVTFRAAIENLFGKEYWGGCRADSVLFTGTGRTFKFTATFDL